MCGLGVLLALPTFGALASGAAQAATSADELDPVDVVEVSGLVDRIVADNIETAIERSQNNGSQAVILQLNSKGAVIGRERMAELLESIAASKVPIAIWVGPSGSRAYGLPAQMLAVADVTAMAPGARVGRTGTLLSVNDTQITFGSDAANDAIYKDTLGFLDAREQKILKFSTDDRGVPVLRNMLYALDGISVRGATLDTVVDALDSKGQVTREATTVRFFKLGLMPRLLHTVASPPSAYLLLTIGVALLIFEFFTAGIGVAGMYKLVFHGSGPGWACSPTSSHRSPCLGLSTVCLCGHRGSRCRCALLELHSPSLWECLLWCEPVSQHPPLAVTTWWVPLALQ